MLSALSPTHWDHMPNPMSKSWGTPWVQKLGSKGMMLPPPALPNFWTCGDAHGLYDMVLQARSGLWIR